MVYVLKYLFKISKTKIRTPSFVFFCFISIEMKKKIEQLNPKLAYTLKRLSNSASPVSGASMNPARSVGPALISGEYRAIWVYVVGPIVGAVAGAWAYNLIRFTNKPLREITKSGSFLKSMSRMNSSA
jgi:hypothetical protein